MFQNLPYSSKGIVNTECEYMKIFELSNTYTVCHHRVFSA